MTASLIHASMEASVSIVWDDLSVDVLLDILEAVVKEILTSVLPTLALGLAQQIAFSFSTTTNVNVNQAGQDETARIKLTFVLEIHVLMEVSVHPQTLVTYAVVQESSLDWTAAIIQAVNAPIPHVSTVGPVFLTHTASQDIVVSALPEPMGASVRWTLSMNVECITHVGEMATVQIRPETTSASAESSGEGRTATSTIHRHLVVWISLTVPVILENTLWWISKRK